MNSPDILLIFTCRWVFRLAFKTVLVFALGWTVLEYLDIDLEELEEEEKDAQDNGKDETEGKDDIVPDKMPEGATFIPLSFYRQRPREVYDGSSPEWQSFLELRKNRKREEATKGMILNLRSLQTRC